MTEQQRDQQPQTDRQPILLCSEDYKNYTDFFADLYQTGVIKNWKIVCLMQLFSTTDDIYLQDSFLGTIICYSEGQALKWIWVSWDWMYDIRDTADAIQIAVTDNTLRYKFHALTYGPANGWQLIGDEQLEFTDAG